MADSVPSSGPAAWTGLFATVAPTMAPTMAPVAAVVQQQQNSNLLPWLNFCVYVLFTFLLLGLMVYINRYVDTWLSEQRRIRCGSIHSRSIFVKIAARKILLSWPPETERRLYL